jgi:transposase
MDKSVIDEIQQLDVSTKTVRRWIQKYEMNGADGLFIKPRSGRPPKLNSDELNQLKKNCRG